MPRETVESRLARRLVRTLPVVGDEGSELLSISPENTQESPATIVTTIVNPPTATDPAELAAALAKLTDAERLVILRALGVG